MISEKDIIYITKRQASIVTAIIAVLGLFLFCLGYFWGKQSVIEDFSQRVVQESVNDLNYLETVQSFAQGSKQAEQTVDTEGTVQIEEKAVEQTQPTVKADPKQSVEQSAGKPGKQYKAILIGFGTKQAAAGFVNRLRKQNISVDIRQRKSKSSSGKISKPWYQVVTRSYSSQADLDRVISKIQKTEKLKASDIKII